MPDWSKYCGTCGAVLTAGGLADSEFRYCICCGREIQVAPDSATSSDRSVEICEIVLERVAMGFMRSDRFRFIARRYANTGPAVVEATDTFEHPSSPYAGGRNERKLYQEAKTRLDSLVSSLISGGWQHEGTYGQSYWEHRFRRIAVT